MNYYEELQKRKDELKRRREIQDKAVADFHKFLKDHIIAIHVGDK